MFTLNRKPRRPFSKQALWFTLDGLTSRIIRQRTNHCVTCGTNWNLTCSHIFSRGHGPTRFDIDPGQNNVSQCSNCNSLHNVNKLPLYSYYINLYGELALADLERRAKSEKHWSQSELCDLVARYKLILKEERAA